MIFLFLCVTYFIQSNNLQAHPCYVRWHYTIPLYVYVPYFPYPFLCQWTSSLLPWAGYSKQCWNELWGAMWLSDHAKIHILMSNCLEKCNGLLQTTYSTFVNSILLPPPTYWVLKKKTNQTKFGLKLTGSGELLGIYSSRYNSDARVASLFSLFCAWHQNLKQVDSP